MCLEKILPVFTRISVSYQMGASGNLLGRGDIEIGIFNTSTKTFTASTDAASKARLNKK